MTRSRSPFRLSSKGRGPGGGGEMLVLCQADQGLSPEKLSRKKEWAKFWKVSKTERSSHSYGYMTTFVKTQN